MRRAMEVLSSGIVSPPSSDMAQDGRGEPILTTQVEYEYMVDEDVTYRFHIDCAGLWQAELRRRGLG
jgi:hypothetical protein